MWVGSALGLSFWSDSETAEIYADRNPCCKKLLPECKQSAGPAGTDPNWSYCSPWTCLQKNNELQYTNMYSYNNYFPHLFTVKEDALSEIHDVQFSRIGQ